MTVCSRTFAPFTAPHRVSVRQAALKSVVEQVKSVGIYWSHRDNVGSRNRASGNEQVMA